MRQAAVIFVLLALLVAGELTAREAGEVLGKSEAAVWMAFHRIVKRLRATLAERQRIAREIHDLVAHSLSVTLLHITGARHALREHGHDRGTRPSGDLVDVGLERRERALRSGAARQSDQGAHQQERTRDPPGARAESRMRGHRPVGGTRR